MRSAFYEFLEAQKGTERSPDRVNLKLRNRQLSGDREQVFNLVEVLITFPDHNKDMSQVLHMLYPFRKISRNWEEFWGLHERSDSSDLGLFGRMIFPINSYYG